jgi:hypothetical protein
MLNPACLAKEQIGKVYRLGCNDQRIILLIELRTFRDSQTGL